MVFKIALLFQLSNFLGRRYEAKEDIMPLYGKSLNKTSYPFEAQGAEEGIVTIEGERKKMTLNL